MFTLEQRLSFWMFNFMKNNHSKNDCKKLMFMLSDLLLFHVLQHSTEEDDIHADVKIPIFLSSE